MLTSNVNDDESLQALPHVNIESIRAEAKAEGEHGLARAELNPEIRSRNTSAIEALHAAELEALRRTGKQTRQNHSRSGLDARSSEIA